MKTIFLIRHAKSSWDNPAMRDFERPLNERGLRDAPFMADVLKKTGAEPDLIVTSPAKRAATTAGFFGRAFGINEADFQVEQTIYAAEPRDISDIIAGLPESVETVLIFGHNPTFTDVANGFSKKWIENVPTCGIVRIEGAVEKWAEFSSENASVTAVFFPKQFLPGAFD